MLLCLLLWELRMILWIIRVSWREENLLLPTTAVGYYFPGISQCYCRSVPSVYIFFWHFHVACEQCLCFGLRSLISGHILGLLFYKIKCSAVLLLDVFVVHVCILKLTGIGLRQAQMWLVISVLKLLLRGSLVLWKILISIAVVFTFWSKFNFGLLGCVTILFFVSFFAILYC